MVVIPSFHGRITREVEIADSARQDFGGKSPEGGQNVARNQHSVIDYFHAPAAFQPEVQASICSCSAAMTSSTGAAPASRPSAS